MIVRQRKGMIIKNTNKQVISVKLSGREIQIPPGETTPVSSEEVMENTLRDLLQVRDLAIVRPLTEQEEEEIQKKIAPQKGTKK